MKRRILIAMTLCGLSTVLFAQTLSGRVVDEKGEPLEMVNVVLFSAKDSTYINGTVTASDGTYTIDSKGERGFLRMALLGFMPAFINYTGQATINQTLTEERRLLDAVIVKSNLPKTRLKGEGMITTVAGSVLEKAGTMEQLLNQIPYVTAQNGNIEVLGRGTPEMYINGRKVVDPTEIKRLHSDEIKQIEVINNPGARYSASVQSVIRITTKRPQGEGWGVDTQAYGQVNEQGRMSWIDNTTLSYRSGGFDVSGTFYGTYSHTQDDKDICQQTYLDDVWKQNNHIEQEYTSINPYARIATSYLFDENKSLGASVSYDRYAKQLGKGVMDGMTFQNEELKESSHTYYQSPSRSTAITANAYYTGLIGKLSVDFNTDYYWNGQKAQMHNDETLSTVGEFPSAQDVKTNRRTYNRLWASKLVLSLPVFKGNLSFGSEYSYTKRKMAYTILPEALVNDEHNHICEDMTAAFVDYSRTIGKMNVQVGLRYEGVNFRYYNQNIRVKDQSKTYNDLFPSVALSWPVGKAQMQLTYASDISRPSYSSLRSGVQYDNRYTYESGNPFLVPSVSRNLTYAFSWKMVNLQAVYSHVSDQICSLMQPYQDDPLKTLMRPENMPGYDNVQFNVFLNPTFGFWSPTLEMSLYKQWFKMDTYGHKKLQNPLGRFRLNNTFDTKWLTATLSMSVQTEGNESNNYMRQGFFNVNLSLSKSLMNDKLTLQLYAEDLFHTADRHIVSYSGPQRTTWIDTHSSSIIAFSARYVFNGRSDKYRGTGAGNSQRSRM